MDRWLRPGERFDDLQRNNLRIIQDPKRFCFGMDAVLLSGFAKVRPGEKVIDLGTGTGIIPLLLSAKTEGEHFTGLELQPQSADMAARSVACNGLQERIDIVEGDIRQAAEKFGTANFDVVTSNPPYMKATDGLKGDSDAKTIARHEVCCSLEDLVAATAQLLKAGGRCYFVHRPFRLVDIFATMREHGIEPKVMQLVYPFEDKEPNMVLIEGVKGGRPQLNVEKPLIIYEEPGVYRPEIYDIYGY